MQHHREGTLPLSAAAHPHPIETYICRRRATPHHSTPQERSGESPLAYYSTY